VTTYRCVFCRRLTEGPQRPAPPCAACGRQTVRVLEHVEVLVVRGSENSAAYFLERIAGPGALWLHLLYVLAHRAARLRSES
jgi:hypothetical protein